MGRSRLLVFIVTSSFLQFSCAANRARVITPNEEEVQVLDGMVPIDFDHDGKADGTTDFLRGKNEQLDEQEFYQAIGDTQSYETVKGSRGAGFALQGVGLAGMLLGIAGAGGGVATYFLSDSSDEKVPVIPVPEDSRGFVLYGVYGAAALAVLGGVLFFAMAGKARGDKRVFELAHARSRLEISLYGENGATPDDIKKLVFGQGNEASRVCVGGALQLAPLIAYDARGRKMKVVDRADWFQWLTTPKPDLIERAPDAPVLHSSLDGSFADIDADLGVAIKVAQTGVGHEMTFTHDFKCGLTFGRDGESGRPGDPGDRGDSGRSGSSSRAPQSGQRGHPGKPGGPGRPGPNVVAEVGWVTTAKRGRLAVLVVDGQGTVFDPKGLPPTVSAGGGAGGQGGHGGRGGSGGSASGCLAGGDGGDGGTGGQGGTGGPGGSVVLRAADPELLRAVRLMASGGQGGRGGDAGSGGSRGTRGSCKKGFPPEGANGAAGAPGGEGGSGADGTTRTEVVALSQLSQLARFVAANPTLTLEGGDAQPQPQPKKRR